MYRVELKINRCMDWQITDSKAVFLLGYQTISAIVNRLTSQAGYLTNCSL